MVAGTLQSLFRTLVVCALMRPYGRPVMTV